MFSSVEALPPDPIFGLQVSFLQDDRPNKINLGIGAYKDDEGQPLVLNCVKKAEHLLLDKRLNKEYLPIQGDADYVRESIKLLFGEESDRIFATQTVGGTSALRVGGDFLANGLATQIYLSDPSWANHRKIFGRTGLEVETYRYYDKDRHLLDDSGMAEAIGQLPERSVVLLQASCHNPTGIDPSEEQWKELSKIILERKLIPFFDIAYQGLGQGFDEDAFAVRQFFADGHEMLVAQSYSKNFGLYGERAGVLSVVAKNGETANRLGTQIKDIIRGIYSTPPLQGARIVGLVLRTPELRKEWEHEVANMRTRIHEMRRTLLSGLMAKGSNGKFEFMNHQRGMFSFSGLSPEQVKKARDQHGLYMMKNGRINVAGLNMHNMDYVIDSIVDVLES